jgi:hypothetical protein
VQPGDQPRKLYMRSAKNSNPARRTNRLKDAVYREMYLLESRRPGSEMGLALALLRAWNEIESLPQDQGSHRWLKQICPLGLKMIEDSLGQGCARGPQGGNPGSETRWVENILGTW